MQRLIAWSGLGWKQQTLLTSGGWFCWKFEDGPRKTTHRLAFRPSDMLLPTLLTVLTLFGTPEVVLDISHISFPTRESLLMPSTPQSFFKTTNSPNTAKQRPQSRRSTLRCRQPGRTQPPENGPFRVMFLNHGYQRQDRVHEDAKEEAWC